MAKLTGRLGKVISTSEIVHCNNWTCDVSIDTEEVTGMGSSVVWRSRITGMLDWTANVECYQKDGTTTAVTPGSAATNLDLYLNASVYLRGSAICTSAEINNPVDGVCTITYAFQGTGTLSIN